MIMLYEVQLNFQSYQTRSALIAQLIRYGFNYSYIVLLIVLFYPIQWIQLIQSKLE